MLCQLLFRSMSRMGVLHVGTYRPLRVPDKRLGGNGHPWCNGWPYFTPRKIPRTICGDTFVGSRLRIRFQEGQFLEDVEGSWQGTWRTGSSLASGMTFVDPKVHVLKVLGLYLNFWLSYGSSGVNAWPYLGWHMDSVGGQGGGQILPAAKIWVKKPK